MARRKRGRIKWREWFPFSGNLFSARATNRDYSHRSLTFCDGRVYDGPIQEKQLDEYGTTAYRIPTDATYNNPNVPELLPHDGDNGTNQAK